MKKLSYLLTLCFLTFGSLIGCGSSGPAQVTETQIIYATIESLGDAAVDEKMFKSAFVDGAAPDNRKDYGSHGYQVVGEPTVDGDTATVPVKIFGGVYESGARDSSSSKPTEAAESEQVWTIQKSGDEWKIKDAPLG